MSKSKSTPRPKPLHPHYWAVWNDYQQGWVSGTLCYSKATAAERLHSDPGARKHLLKSRFMGKPNFIVKKVRLVMVRK